jgi:hypothetical protein
MQNINILRSTKRTIQNEYIDEHEEGIFILTKDAVNPLHNTIMQTQSKSSETKMTIKTSNEEMAKCIISNNF